MNPFHRQAREYWKPATDIVAIGVKSCSLFVLIQVVCEWISICVACRLHAKKPRTVLSCHLQLGNHFLYHIS